MVQRFYRYEMKAYAIMPVLLLWSCAKASTFSVASGPCVSTENCFHTFGYPTSNYSVNELCYVVVNGNFNLKVHTFEVELGCQGIVYDQLLVGGEIYQGSSGPDGVTVDPSTNITWISDESTTFSGFEICADVCPEGQYGSLPSFKCAICLDGQYSSADSTACQSTCPVGTYVSGSKCLTCPPGKYQGNPSALVPNCADCEPGKYSRVNVISCSFCTAGKYQGLVGQPSCEFCDTGQFSSARAATCVYCFEGSFAAETGSAECSSCPVGRFSSRGAVKCSVEACAAGKYGLSVSDCTACPSGQFSPQATEGATACSDCDFGKYSGSMASACTPCSAGTYQNQKGSPECTNCLAGHFSVAIGASFDTCNDCSRGTFQSLFGAITCVSCDAGKYSTWAATVCSACSPGRSSGANAIVCLPCIQGMFSDAAGVVSCKECALGRTSRKEASECALAAAGRFLDATVPLSATTPDYLCPLSSVCQGYEKLPQPDEGSWTSHSELKFAAVVYRCDRKTCLGADISKDVDCWNRANFATPACQVSSLTCSEGAIGPVCGSCKDGYSYSSSSRSCKTCADWASSVFVTIAALICVGLMGVVVYKCPKRLPLPIVNSWAFIVFQQMDTAKYKILWCTGQLVGSVAWTLGVEWPPIFEDFLRALAFFSFDFLSIDCASNGANFYRVVYLWTGAPVALAVLIALSYFIRKSLAGGSDSKETSFLLRTNHFSYFLVLSYVVLPATTLKQFQGLVCVSIAGRRVLKVDTSLDCESAQHQAFRVLDGTFIGVYIGIPLMWLILLCQRRDDLNPNTTDTRLKYFLRDSNVALNPIRFLFDVYKPQFFYLEVVEMCRRVLLVAVLPLMSEIPARRAAIGMLISFFSLVIYREIEPFRITANDSLMYLAQIVLFMIYGSGLVISTGLQDGIDNNVFGGILVLVNIVVIIAAFGIAGWKSHQLQVEEFTKLSKRATKVEWAVGWSAEKHRTTLDALTNRHVPVSDCLAYWYCSASQAHYALEAGIPVSKDREGIVFSLHRPYETDEHDEIEFPNKSAVVVIAMPRQFLQSFSAIIPHLVILPAKLLGALRSEYFDLIPKPELWYKRGVFFPPQRLVRAYELVEVHEKIETASVSPMQDHLSVFTMPSIVQPTSCLSFVESMRAIRKTCSVNGWFPLYHYTASGFRSLIAKSGFRMSTQGQGDGGVYFSVKGPTSYHIGTGVYEDSIIIDCFGANRLDEFRSKNKLDVVFVYGMEATALSQAPGGRDNAFMISKPTFELLSLPDTNGNYFLRPDRILGIFHLDPANPPEGADEAQDELELEREADQSSKDAILSALRVMDQSDASIMRLTVELNPSASHRRRVQRRNSNQIRGAIGSDEDVESNPEFVETNQEASSSTLGQGRSQKRLTMFQRITARPLFQTKRQFYTEDKEVDGAPCAHQEAELSHFPTKPMRSSVPSQSFRAARGISHNESGSFALGTSMDKSMRRTSDLSTRL